MVSGVEHPHVVVGGVAFAEGLPVVAAAEQPVEDDEVPCVPLAAGQMPGVKGQPRHARYCATALDKPKYKASAIKAWPMLTSSRWGTSRPKSARLSRFKSCPALTPSPAWWAHRAASA